MTTLRIDDMMNLASAAAAEARSIIAIIGVGVVGEAETPF